MPQFKAGDVVRISPIKGPWMIIEACEENRAICFWFDKNDAYHRETFVPEFLRYGNPTRVAFLASLVHGAKILS